MKNRVVTGFLATVLLIAFAAVPVPAEAAQKAVKGATPTISGGFFGGGILAVRPGTWTAGAKLKIKWVSDGFVIPQAISRTLQVPSNLVGHTISVVVTGSKPGMKAASRSSKGYSIGLIYVGAKPQIVGDLSLGAALTLSECVCNPSIQTKQIQWYRSGVAIPGANANSYIMTADDFGAVISAQITVGVPGYQSVALNTDPTLQFLQTIQKLSSPIISYSSLAPGSLFTVQPGTYNPQQVSLNYQWLANGSPIAGQTGSTFSPDSSFGGKTITVVESASAAGYATLNQSTTAVGPILTIQTYTSSRLDASNYFLSCGGGGYRTCEQDVYGVSGNTLGERLYAGIYTSDAVSGMFGVSLPSIDPSKVLRWRVTTSGRSGLGVQAPGIMSSTSSSWYDLSTSSMSLLSKDGVAVSNWYTTPMGSDHSLYWGIFHSDWGSYYVDSFVIEVQYLG